MNMNGRKICWMNSVFSKFISSVFLDRCLHCTIDLAQGESFLCCFCEAMVVRPLPTTQVEDSLTAITSFVGASLKKDGPTETLVHALKYHSGRGIGRKLGLEIALNNPNIISPDVLIPVPIHHKKQFKRGYNQSLSIAEGLGERLGVPVCSNAVKKICNSKSQTTLSPEDRRLNVEKFFSWKKGLDPRIRHVGIVDDVITTGATALALAKLLKTHYKELDITIFAAAMAQE